MSSAAIAMLSYAGPPSAAKPKLPGSPLNPLVTKPLNTKPLTALEAAEGVTPRTAAAIQASESGPTPRTQQAIDEALAEDYQAQVDDEASLQLVQALNRDYSCCGALCRWLSACWFFLSSCLCFYSLRRWWDGCCRPRRGFRRMHDHSDWSEAEIRQAFNRFDANRSGKLDYRELREALRAKQKRKGWLGRGLTAIARALLPASQTLLGPSSMIG